MTREIFSVTKGKEIRIDESAWSTPKRDGFAYFNDAGELHMLPEISPPPAGHIRRFRAWLASKIAPKVPA